MRIWVFPRLVGRYVATYCPSRPWNSPNPHLQNLATEWVKSAVRVRAPQGGRRPRPSPPPSFARARPRPLALPRRFTPLLNPLILISLEFSSSSPLLSPPLLSVVPRVPFVVRLSFRRSQKVVPRRERNRRRVHACTLTHSLARSLAARRRRRSLTQCSSRTNPQPQPPQLRHSSFLPSARRSIRRA